MISDVDFNYLKLAVELADRSPKRSSSFSVGAVIASEAGGLISTGFTGELGDHWHAEETAIEKARRLGVGLDGAVLYCSVEPCGERLSGRVPCTDHILAAGIGRVVYCIDEPPVFVHPRGSRILREAGVTVERDDRLAARVLRSNSEPLRLRKQA